MVASYCNEVTILLFHLTIVSVSNALLPRTAYGFYWYGNKRHGPGRPPKWIDNLVASAQAALPEIVPTADEQPKPHAQVSTHVKPKVQKSSPNPSQPVEHRYPLRSRTNQKTHVLKARMFQNAWRCSRRASEREGGGVTK